MTPAIDTSEAGAKEMPSFGIKRIQAALAVDPALADVRVDMVDFERADIEAYLEAIEGVKPDLIGISMYVWSTPCLIEVARLIKQRNPECTIVFGGPSARTAVFDLPPYPAPHEVLDAVVAREGEVTFTEIARLPELSRDTLASVGGLDVPSPTGWKHTGPRTPIDSLDDIASPYRLGLMPRHSVAYLETYRGCPMSCRFCEWGTADNSSTSVFSTDYIQREFAAYERADASAVFLLDAGLNLNAQGFRNLKQAEDATGFLRRCGGLWAEIYPSNVRDEHLEFLADIGASYLGIGLQSLDPAVLKDQERPFKQDRFEESVRRLAEVADAEIQIIMGLPGDTPDGFRRTLEFARKLPVSVRAYHCLVLPDALLTRSRPDWDIEFDPLNLAMTACKGWTEYDFPAMREYVTELALAAGGSAGDFWWFFPRGA